MAQEKFDVGGMTCAACQAHVEKAVCKLHGVTDVAVNLLSGSMQVTFDETLLSDDDILRRRRPCGLLGGARRRSWRRRGRGNHARCQRERRLSTPRLPHQEA